MHPLCILARSTDFFPFFQADFSVFNIRLSRQIYFQMYENDLSISPHLISIQSFALLAILEE